jgi:hypothetical protein
MSEKLPYWKHPDYDNTTDPDYIEYELSQLLEPITREHAYSFVQRCICDQKNDEHDPLSIEYSFGIFGTEQFPPFCPQQKIDFGRQLATFSEEDDHWVLNFQISKIRQDLFAINFESHPSEPDFPDYAWEGGEVDFRAYSAKEIEENAVFLEKMRAEMHEINSQYEPYPFKRNIFDAILVKSESAPFAKSVIELIQNRQEKLFDFVVADVKSHGALQEFLYDDWTKISLHPEEDPVFYEELTRSFRDLAG